MQSVRVAMTTTVLVLAGVVLLSGIFRTNAVNAFQGGLGANGDPTVNSSSVNFLGPRFFFWDAAAMDKAFHHPEGPTPFLYSGEGGRRNFEIHTDHRTKAGQVEYHALNWDVVYVYSGSATFEVGGTGIMNPKQIGPNEFTGSDIAGGPIRTVHLTKGVFYMVPNGVPHWYKEVQQPLDYMIIKIRDGSIARDPMDGKSGFCDPTSGGTNARVCK